MSPISQTRRMERGTSNLSRLFYGRCTTVDTLHTLHAAVVPPLTDY